MPCSSPIRLDLGRPRPDGLDAHRVRDHVLRPPPLRVRADPEADRRAARPDPRGVDEADKARQEARELRELTEARARGGEGRARAHPRRGRQAPRPSASARGGGGGRRQRRLEENKRADRGETKRALDQIRRDVVELTLLAAEKVTGKALDAERSAPADRRGDRGARLLGAGERGPRPWPSPSACTPRPSSRPRRRPDRVDAVREELGAFAAALDECRRAPRASSATPRWSRDEGRRARAARGRRGRDRPQLRPAPRGEGTRRRARGDPRGVRALSPRAKNAPRGRAHDRVRALGRGGAGRSSQKIEEASGRRSRRRGRSTRPHRRHRRPGRLDARRRERRAAARTLRQELISR